MSFLRSTICVSGQALYSQSAQVESLFYFQTSLVRGSFRYGRNVHPVAANSLGARSKQIQKVSMSSSTAVLDTNSNGIFNQMLSKFANSKSVSFSHFKNLRKFQASLIQFIMFQKLRASSTLLYENVADKINYYEFFGEFDLPDTFNSWFLVTELHCWLLLTRVMQEGSESGQDGRFIRNCIVETLWGDVQTRAKKLSLDNPSASRSQVAILAEQFQAALIIYDEGLMSDDKILANALWRRFFNMKCDDFTKLEKLVKYVRKTTMQLDNMTRQQLISKPQIVWGKFNE